MAEREEVKLPAEIDRLLAERNLTLNAFANRVGINSSYAREIKMRPNAKIGHEIAIRIADTFGESRLRWLHAAGYADFADAIAQAWQMERVPLVATVPGGPDGGTVFDEPDEELVPIGFMEGADMALRVVGESMIPTYPPGAIVSVKLTRRVPDKGPVIVLLKTAEHTIKRWKDTPRGPKLVSDNPDQKQFPPLDPKDAQIVGVPIRVYLPQTWEAK